MKFICLITKQKEKLQVPTLGKNLTNTYRFQLPLVKVRNLEAKESPPNYREMTGRLRK